MSNTTKTVTPHVGGDLLAHVLIMQRLHEAILMARAIHPEFHSGDMLGRALLVTWITERVERIIDE